MENFIFCAMFDCYAIHAFLKLKNAQRSIQMKECSHNSFREETKNETFFKNMLQKDLFKTTVHAAIFVHAIVETKQEYIYWTSEL